ncbi:MAG TPA: sugar phosphate nucleotidyltransferase, partial [Acidimicrobiia bacterium]
MTPTVRPVILSGGAGTRLWPLSTEGSPKQFMRLLGEPLFESTLNRLREVEGVGPVTVVTGADYVDAVERAARRVSMALDSIIIEPAGRNTAPAVIAAALIADPDDVLVVLPSDHVIADGAAFGEAVNQGVNKAVDGALVIFGVEPSRPETGYGYIEKGEAIAGAYRVARFKEKPEVVEAERLAGAGTHLWNCGIFVFTAARVLEEAKGHIPELVGAVEASLPTVENGRIVLDRSFEEVTSISIDHAVMEKTDSAVVIEADFGWSDIGSWQSLWMHSERDPAGNVLAGEVIAVDVTDSYVRSTSRR